MDESVVRGNYCWKFQPVPIKQGKQQPHGTEKAARTSTQRWCDKTDIFRAHQYSNTPETETGLVYNSAQQLNRICLPGNSGEGISIAT
jgi:hypothetical protein